jgi:hypothetical protein
MTRWEYQLITFVGDEDEAIASQLNELGSQGWEVMGMTNPIPVERRKVLTFVLKRPAS